MFLKPTGAVLSTPERAAEIEVAFRLHGAMAQIDFKRGRHRFQGHAGAGDERFEQHVAGAQLRAGAAGGGVQARDRERAAGLDLAGDVLVIERALRLQGDDGGVRVAAVLVLQRRLKGAKRGRIHDFRPWVEFTTTARRPADRVRAGAAAEVL